MARLVGLTSIAALLAIFLLITLIAQRRVSAIRKLSAQVAQAQEILADGKSGYRSRISNLIRDNPDVITQQPYRDAIRKAVIGSMGDPAAFAPRCVDLVNVATVSISDDGAWIAIALGSGKIELRKTSQLDTVAFELVNEAWEQDWPISLRFVGKSNHELLSLSHQGLLSRFEWTEQGSDYEIEQLERFRKFDRNDKGEPETKIMGAAISEDGNRVAFCDASSVEVYDLSLSETVFSETPKINDGVKLKAVAISKDQKYLAAGYSDTTGSVSGLMRWDLDTSEPFKKVALNRGTLYENGIAFDPLGDYLAVGGERTSHYEVSSMEERQFFEGSESAAFAFSPNGGYMAVSFISNDVQIRHRKSSAVVAELQYRKTGGRRGIAFNGTGKYLAAWNSSGVQIVNCLDTSERLELLGHERGVPAIQFTKDGTHLISTSKAGRIRYWNTTTGEMEREVELHNPVQCIALDEDRQMLVAATWGTEPKLEILHFPDFTPIGQIDNDLGTVCGLELLSDGKQLAATGERGLNIWNLVRTKDNVSFEVTYEDAFDAGKFLIYDQSASRLYHAKHWWNVGWVDLSEYHEHDFAQDRKLLMGYNSMALTDEGYLAFVNPQGGLEAWNMTARRGPTQMKSLPEGTFCVSTIKISQQGRLAGLTNGKTVVVWDINSQQRIYEFREELNAVWSLAWSPDGEQLAVGLSDGGLSIWNLAEIRNQLIETGFPERSESVGGK